MDVHQSFGTVEMCMIFLQQWPPISAKWNKTVGYSANVYVAIRANGLSLKGLFNVALYHRSHHNFGLNSGAFLHAVVAAM